MEYNNGVRLIQWLTYRPDGDRKICMIYNTFSIIILLLLFFSTILKNRKCIIYHTLSYKKSKRKEKKPMTLGKRLIRFRAENNLSQQKLADMCKISKQTLFMIEKYDISISPLTREKIELVIGKERKE